MVQELPPSHEAPLIVPTQQDIPQPAPSASSTEPRQKFPVWIIILIVLYAIVLYAGVYYFFFYKKTTRTSSQGAVETEVSQPLPSTPTPEKTSSASASFETLRKAAAVPLYLVPFYAKDQEPIREQKGTIIFPVTIPPVVLNNCAAYRFETYTVLGPKNWYADGTVTNGKTLIRIFPYAGYTDLNAGFFYEFTSPGSQAAVTLASPYFWRIHEDTVVLGLKIPLPTFHQDYDFQFIGDYQSHFAYVNSLGMDVQGVAYTDISSHHEDKQWKTYVLTTITSIDEATPEYITALLDTFLEQYQLK